MTTHEALLPLPHMKFSFTEPAYKGNCTCGWIQNGFGTAREARKVTKAHVKDATENENGEITWTPKS